MPSHRVQPFLAALLLMSLLQAHNALSGQLTASWDDNSAGEAAFIIERRLTEEPTFTPVGDLAAGITAYVDPAITDGLTYCYRVKAYDSLGESPYSDEACGASMPLPTGYSIAVLKAGTGAGTVVSAPAGIDCGVDCEEAYGSGTLVTLNAAPASGSRFVGWSGGCFGTSICTVAANSAVAVTATFNVLSRGQAKKLR